MDTSRPCQARIANCEALLHANILDLRVLDRNGMSSDSAVIAAIQQAVQLKNKYNVRVITCRWAVQFMRAAIGSAVQGGRSSMENGIVVVVAAGNVGRNGMRRSCLRETARTR